MKSDLTGKDILVTGATGVIGGAIARALSDEGARVWLAGRDEKKLEALREIPNSRVLPAADLSWTKEAQDTVGRFFSLACYPYGLVCNAGILTEGPLESLSINAMLRCWDVNFFSHAAMIQRFISYQGMRSGHVVTMSGAGLGSSRSFANMSAYSTAKAALVHLCEALADEVPHISFNAVAPGAVRSNMNKATDGAVSPTLAARLIVWLMKQDEPIVTGRLLSARFDTDWLTEHANELDADRFRMRRVLR